MIERLSAAAPALRISAAPLDGTWEKRDMIGMSDVFISYSHTDSKYADEICHILDECGIEYFRDVKNIGWGDSIKGEVRNALENNSAILVIISPASLKSQWVPYELGFASALNKKILPYLTHPALDVPHYIRDLTHFTEIEQVKEFFSNSFNVWQREIRQKPSNSGIGSIVADPTIREMSIEARMLLVEASKDRKGIIMRLRTNKGLLVQTNGQQFCDSGDPRSEAAWDHAVDELIENGYTKDVGNKGEVFNVTQKGYEKADRIDII